MPVRRRDHKQVAEETLTALRRGYYSTDEGVRRALAPSDRVRDAPGKTLVHKDTRTLLASVPATKEISKGEDTCELTFFVGGSFEAAQWLLSTAATLNRQLQTPAVLDFASDSNPGGSFRGRQQGTQEEELCRQSNLGVCLEELYERTRVVRCIIVRARFRQVRDAVLVLRVLPPVVEAAASLGVRVGALTA